MEVCIHDLVSFYLYKSMSESVRARPTPNLCNYTSKIFNIVGG